MLKLVAVERAQSALIQLDLKKKMVLLSGPRQAGKTTLAKRLTRQYERQLYLNYDADQDRGAFIKEMWPRDTQLLVLDEIHKYKRWKNKLKGIYDTRSQDMQILVTGSARLNLLHRAGDSLAGRYYYHRLYPFSYKELRSGARAQPEILRQMFNLGSFPEPFLGQSETDAKRWRHQYLQQLLTQDIVQLAHVGDLSAMRLLVDLLRQRVGSPISFKALSEDLHISPNTVMRYVELLEQLYVLFRVTPYHKNIARSLLKEPKIYFYDIGAVEGDDGKKFENLIALHLLKHVHFIEDTQGEQSGLYYIKDKQKHEVDFFYLQSKNDSGTMIEAKLTDTQFSDHLGYFQQRLPQTKALQVVLNTRRALQQGAIRLEPATEFLAGLNI